MLTVAQLAGVMGAKHTALLIPLCHPLLLSKARGVCGLGLGCWRAAAFPRGTAGLAASRARSAAPELAAAAPACARAAGERQRRGACPLSACFPLKAPSPPRPAAGRPPGARAGHPSSRRSVPTAVPHTHNHTLTHTKTPLQVGVALQLEPATDSVAISARLPPQRLLCS